jgi:hypothetical protein
MCVDCVLASLRIAQVDPGDKPLPEVVLSHEALRPLVHPLSRRRVAGTAVFESSTTVSPLLR